RARRPRRRWSRRRRAAANDSSPGRTWLARALSAGSSARRQLTTVSLTPRSERPPRARARLAPAQARRRAVGVHRARDPATEERRELGRVAAAAARDDEPLAVGARAIHAAAAEAEARRRERRVGALRHRP